ncbi:hypothetical protein SUGI_0601930 [Cryptomeria japonica]|nr:hypothetical protein SUGI_0601930 [Cryptomeria japonica]
MEDTSNGCKDHIFEWFIEEEVYIEQPEGFSTHDRNLYVCRLKKALYGLKQAPRAWYERKDSYLSKLGYSKNEADSNIYFKISDGDMLILVLYVDDLLITREDHLIAKCNQDLMAEFDMKDLGLLHYFHKLKSEAVDSEPIDPTYYRQIIGSLMYLVNTRPDICYATNVLSHFMCEPKKIHLMVAKHILRYLCGTIGLGLKYKNVEIQLQGYSDSDWAGSSIDRKSTTGCCFSLGSAMIFWFSRKQSAVAQSSTDILDCYNFSNEEELEK